MLQSDDGVRRRSWKGSDRSLSLLIVHSLWGVGALQLLLYFEVS